MLRGKYINQNTEIYASGNHVYVMWWANKTGSNPIIKTGSNDNGNTYGRAITPNRTGVPVAVQPLRDHLPTSFMVSI
jgi:hypothetical protein